MLMLTQSSWSPNDAPELYALVAAAAREAVRQSESGSPDVLLLLPHAPLGDAAALREEDIMDVVKSAATTNKMHLAGSAVMQAEGASAPQTIGFIVASNGDVLLRTLKVSPDLIEGFTDTTSAMGQPAEFPVATLPFAKVGMLCGEDIHFPQYGRALAFHGAEIILNPCVERSDQQFDHRVMSRFGRASESVAYVAVASPAEMKDGGLKVKLPSATALYPWEREATAVRGDETFVIPDIDMQLLRRRRVTPQGSFPAIVRADVYGRGYKIAKETDKIPAAPTTRDGWLKEAERRLATEAEVRGPKHPNPEFQYDCMLVQTVARLIPIGGNADPREIIRKNLDEHLSSAGSRLSVPTMRLCVFPEFWLTGPGGIGGVQRTVQNLERMAISEGDEIFDIIGKFAQEYNVYVAFQNFEVHPKLPGRVFNSAFLIDDQGNHVHTYRKNQCADVWGLLPDTTPGSVLDEYLDLFGYDALFPVADTPIGKLANMVCFDNMSPEVAGGLRRQGAEVILHSTSEPHGGEGRRAWDNARRTRAMENCAYMLSAMDGGEYKSHDSEHMTFFRRGHTRLVNFDGSLQGTVDGPGPVLLRAHIDLGALRRARANPRTNFQLWNDPAVYADAYSPDMGFPSNMWAGDPYDNPYIGAKAMIERIESYVEQGIYTPPVSQLSAETKSRTSDVM
ncbi:MAG: nitrilase-related carbon-nitrogen hydrolase [Rhodospirillaceae bacterium]